LTEHQVIDALYRAEILDLPTYSKAKEWVARLKDSSLSKKKPASSSSISAEAQNDRSTYFLRGGYY